jgi:PAT family beta-lactamase induction signal transducer AmpG
MEEQEHWRGPTWLFAAATLPLGVVGGFMLVAFPFLAAKQGMSVAVIGSIIGAKELASLLKIVWTPAIDLVATPRTWMTATTGLCGLLLLFLILTPALPGMALPLALLAFATAAAASTTAAAGAGLMALALPPEALSSAAGYFQCGQLVTQGLTGALAVWLGARFGAPAVAAALCAVCLLALAASRLLPDARGAHLAAPIPGRLKAIALDLWSLARSPRGLFVILAFCGPIGIGAASFLWSGVAVEWHADAATVAVATGLGAAMATALGAFAYGKIIGRMDRVRSFLLTGALLAGAAILMAVLPRTPAAFTVGALVYAACLGCAYTSFTALSLEVIGKGAAASKACALNAVGNLPVAYMPVILGFAHDRWSTSAMLWLEAGLGAVFVLAFALADGWLRGRIPSPLAEGAVS